MGCMHRGMGIKAQGGLPGLQRQRATRGEGDAPRECIPDASRSNRVDAGVRRALWQLQC